MDFRYQSEEWSSHPRSPAEPSTTPRQSLDGLINKRCRAGWELQGVYPESPDGSKYLLLFRTPCEAWKLLADFAREKKPSEVETERQQAAAALLKDLQRIMKGAGFAAELASENRELTVTGGGLDVAVNIDAKGCITLATIVPTKGRTTPPVLLAFNPARGAFEPTSAPAPQTALDVLVQQILGAV